MMADSGFGNGVYSEDVHFTTCEKKLVFQWNNECFMFHYWTAILKSYSKRLEIDDLLKGIVNEFSIVAETEGARLDVERKQHNYLKATAEKVGSTLPSMYQDLKKIDALTEIDFLNGTVAKEARGIGLEAPIS